MRWRYCHEPKPHCIKDTAKKEEKDGSCLYTLWGLGELQAEAVQARILEEILAV